jgi:hypothetical protein
LDDRGIAKETLIKGYFSIFSFDGWGLDFFSGRRRLDFRFMGHIQADEGGFRKGIPLFYPSSGGRGLSGRCLTRCDHHVGYPILPD